MARLIVKSPYIKCGGGNSAGGYMRYIATRERVELIQNDRPPTRKQEQLIAKLVKNFPDAKEMGEYGDYQEHPTKANASAFISQALEENWSDVQKSDGYMKYIATRPRAERLGSHGLFGDKDGVELDKAMAELESYTGNVWTHIISLKREDAERLGYDNARAWRNLLRAHRNDIAAAMNIPPQDFRWYAAFHDEGDHPHVHMMAWSVKPGQAYLSQDGIRQIKSKLTNDIFQQEMLHLYEQKTISCDQLVREARQVMRELVQQMKSRICDHPEAEQLMQELALQLETVRGKKSYGYLPKKQKALVDEIVDQMEQLPTVAECYENGGSCKVRWKISILRRSGTARRCPSRRNSAKSRTRSSRKQRPFGWEKSPSRMIPWTCTRTMRWTKIKMCPGTSGHFAWMFRMNTRHWQNGMMPRKVCGNLRRTVTSMRSILWENCIGTARCCRRTG